jgi:hypothetical protein
MVYNRCSITHCKSQYGKGLLLRGIPKDPVVSEKWFKNCPGLKVSSNTAVCEVSES